jgi:hypothetical protein
MIIYLYIYYLIRFLPWLLFLQDLEFIFQFVHMNLTHCAIDQMARNTSFGRADKKIRDVSVFSFSLS